jgi:hypothetical protein
MPAPKKAPAKKSVAKTATPSKKAAPVAKKSAVTKKSTPQKTEAPTWSTIHIFGYGESQVIGHGTNGKVANVQLKALAPLYATLTKRQQKGTKINPESTHALNIFNGSHIDYRPRMGTGGGQRIAWADADTKAINNLAKELMSKVPKQKEGDGRGLFGGMLSTRTAMPKPRVVAAKKVLVKKKPAAKK